MDGASPAGSLRILFSMRNFWYVRHFEPVIREMAHRRHEVHLLAERPTNERAEDWEDAAAALAGAVPGVTYSTAPRADEDVWYDLRLILRLGLDYLRFTTPAYRPLSQLVARARERTPRLLRVAADSAPGRSAAGRWLLGAILGAAERVMPPDPALAAEIAERRPDVIAITPLIELGSEQADVVRVARTLGVPTALCAGSWDHLSSKGLIRAMPDRIVVWNQTQKREAIEMHGVPEGVIDVTGAQVFDEWFDRHPVLEREPFCRKVGLDPAQPYVLYVCSALLEGSPAETEFLLRWIETLRATPALRHMGILVRPHPKRAAELEAAALGAAAGVAVWPRCGLAPTTAETKADYFDSLYHAAAVVGINTSALIEGGIVGRPVLTIIDPAYAGNQEGTLHFRYLVDGGLLHVARTFDEHAAQLALAIATPDARRNESFVRSFVRPNGLDQSATPLVIASIEQVAARRPSPQPVSLAARVGRLLLWPAARGTAGRFGNQVARARRRKAEDAERSRRRDEAVARRLAERAARTAAKMEEARLAREAVMRERARAKAEKLEAHRLAKRAAKGKP
jgi:hypothetical protein